MESNVLELLAQQNTIATVDEMIRDFPNLRNINGMNHLINALTPFYEKYYYSYQPNEGKPLFTDIIMSELSQYFQLLVEPNPKTLFQTAIDKLKHQGISGLKEREPTQIAYMLNMTDFDELIANIEARIKDYS